LDSSDDGSVRALEAHDRSFGRPDPPLPEPPLSRSPGGRLALARAGPTLMGLRVSSEVWCGE
jgi:hypothetical protein